MRLRWNPAGKGIKTIPSELEQFARSKRREFFLNMIGSAAAGIAITHALNWSRGDADALTGAALLQR